MFLVDGKMVQLVELRHQVAGQDGEKTYENGGKHIRNTYEHGRNRGFLYDFKHFENRWILLEL